MAGRSGPAPSFPLHNRQPASVAPFPKRLGRGRPNPLADPFIRLDRARMARARSRERRIAPAKGAPLGKHPFVLAFCLFLPKTRFPSGTRGVERDRLGQTAGPRQKKIGRALKREVVERLVRGENGWWGSTLRGRKNGWGRK
jgi:hypothetical protein